MKADNQNIFLYAVLICFNTLPVRSANILFISSTPSPSHQKPFQQVWTSLALKGHEIHVVTPNPLKDNTLPKLVQYNISEVYEWVSWANKNYATEVKYSLEKPSFYDTFKKEFFVSRSWHALYEYTLNLKEVKKLIEAKPILHFDAVIVELLYPTLAAFGGYFEAPLIGICSLGAPTNILDAAGNLLHPIISPDQNIPMKRGQLSFPDRLLSFLYSAWIRLLHQWYILPREDKLVKRHFGENMPYLGEIERNISLLLLNRNQISHRIMQVVPSVVEFGGFSIEKSVQTLSPDLEAYLQKSKQGVIYFSLGSAINQVVFLTPAQINIFKTVLGSLPYNVLWKYENETMENKPNNVFISAWLNQTAVLVTFWTLANGSKILFLTCTPAPSHQKPFQVIWKELSLKGHEVHVLTPSPLNDPALTNLTEYDLSEYYELLIQHSQDNIKYLLHKPTFLSAFVKDVFATKMFSALYNRTLNHRETRRLLGSNKYFDVVIVEWLFPTLASIGAYYKAPIIGVTSLGAPIVALDTVGNPSHPVLAPDMNLPLKRELSFKERILAVIYSIYVRIFYRLVILPREDLNIKNRLGNDLPYIGDIEKNISVLLMNRNPVFHRVMPLFPNTIDLGGIRVGTVKTPLEPGLKKFIDDSKNGVIYFSLGSSMKSIHLDEDVIVQLQNVFRNLPYKIIWKWEEETMIGKPDNVYISKWISQPALLDHPNVKLFITQGGLQSMEETIAAHKPIIGIPFHSDQTTNVDTCVQYGMGKMLDLEDLTEDTLRSYILEIMNNSSYTENAKKLDDLMKDQPQDGLEKAIWWIEYVIRHKGARHLRSAATDLPWWQYLMLDVLGFIFVIILSIIFSLYVLLKLLFKLVGIVLSLCVSNSNLKKKKKNE